MIIVTGGFGFIGSNIVKAILRRSNKEVIAVDNLSDGRKFRNLQNAEIADFYSISEFNERLRKDNFPRKVECIIHMGACSNTTVWDGNYLIENNYNQTKAIFEYSVSRDIQLIYASSASVYGLGERGFSEDPVCENPINMYAYSKWLFDQYFRRWQESAGKRAKVVGLRFFNVYGHGESFKGRMASTIHKFTDQIIDDGVCRLFDGNGLVENGGHRRDFVFVDDISKLALWLLLNDQVSGIFNVGSGVSRSFNDVASIIIKTLEKGRIEYIPFPSDLVGSYQANTCADLSSLRAAGYDADFSGLELGIRRFLTSRSEDM